MAELVAAGKVRHLGLSEAGAGDDPPRARGAPDRGAVQSEYSLWSRDIEDEVIPALRELGIGLVAYSPARPWLSHRARSARSTTCREDDYRRLSPRFQGDNFEKNLELVERIEQLAGEKGVHAVAAGAGVGDAPGRRRGADPGHQAPFLPGAERRRPRRAALRRRARADRRRAAGGRRGSATPRR